MLPTSRDQVVTVEWYSDVSLEGVGTLEQSRIKVLFANIGQAILTFLYFFQILLIFFRNFFLCTSLPDTKLEMFDRYGGASLHAGRFESLEHSRVKVLFVKMPGFVLTFFSFLQILLIPFNDFYYFSFAEPAWMLCLPPLPQ